MNLRPSEMIWWLKIVFAVGVAGLTVATQVLIGLDGITSLLIGVIIYLALSALLSNMTNIERNRGLRIGVGAYFFIWLMAWILLFTIFGQPS